MAASYEEFTEAWEIRKETLRLVEGIDQAQSEHRVRPEIWSPGEVLDHLVRLDRMIVRELETTLSQRRRGLPFVYRGIADIDSSIPWIFRPILPFFEVPFGFVNSLLPQVTRRAFTGSRSIPLKAPGFIEPRYGRDLVTLREELESTYPILAAQQEKHPDIDLDRTYYYNPITGLNSVSGLYRFVSNHEQRHQKQLQEILEDSAFAGSGSQES